MKNIILHILCEGQTEERFVKKVLSPYLQPFGIYPKPILLLTSKKKNASGGMISFAKARNDMEILLRHHRDNSVERHIFSTMFDYYALPNDFPGFGDSLNVVDIRRRIDFLEQKMGKEFKSNRLIPYIQLHEFESLLFTDISKLTDEYPDALKQISDLVKETSGYVDPEMINNGPETAPSKRIIRTLHERYEYNKVQSGTNISLSIGIENIMSKCQHFNDWVQRIIALSQSL